MIVAAMLIGPGETHRHLDRVLRCASEWADAFAVVLDGEDADNALACLRYTTPAVIGDGRTPGPLFLRDESAARNALLAEVDSVAAEGDIVVVLDADEELVGLPDTRLALADLAARADEDAWQARFYHLWAPDGTLCRTDRGWAPHDQVRVYRHRPGGRVTARPLACPAYPDWITGAALSPLVMRHWGYAYPHDRHAKFHRYTTLDDGAYHSGSHIASILDHDPILEPAP